MTTKKVNYAVLKAELEQVLAALQQPESDVDTALKNYERGMILVGQLEDHLKTAENKLTQLRASEQ